MTPEAEGGIPFHRHTGRARNVRIPTCERLFVPMQPLPSTEPPLLRVLHEDAELLVVNKPAGLVCHPTKGDGYSSLVARARLYVGPSAPLHLVNRLDRETSGVTVMTKSARVAGELGTIWEQRGVKKDYLAIVHGHVAADDGVLNAPLGKDAHSPVAIKDCVRPDGSAALTRFRVERRFLRDGRAFSLLQVALETGRKHQIRIHLAHAGHPIVGDKLYGADEQLYLRFVRGELTTEQWEELILTNHALHAVALRFVWREREWEFRAEAEAEFNGFCGAAQRAPDRDYKLSL